MNTTSVQKPAAAAADTRNTGDANAMIDHGGEVNAVDENGDTALHLVGVSGETRNTAGDVDAARSGVELHHESDTKYVKSDNEATIVESNGSENSEHSYSPSEIKELIPNQENHDYLITEAKADDNQDIQYVCENDEEQGHSQLHIVAKRGDTEAVRSLLMSSANVDVLDKKYNTPLHIASLSGLTDVVKLLLNSNASVNFRNVLGQTSLHLAAEIGHLAIAQILLQSNADVHVIDQSNNTPIDIAAARGHYELVQLLMRSNKLPFKWVLPLHNAVKCGNTKGVQQRLLDYDENPDATNGCGDTPIQLASKNGHSKVVEVLLRNKAEANIRNESCKTPLHIAAKMGHAEIVKAVIDHYGEVNAVDRNDDTALHDTAWNGYLKVAEVLLTHNADIDNRDASGMTPLHIADALGYAEIVKAIIGHKGEVNAVDSNGNTALHYAASNGHSAVVNVLLNQTKERDAQIRSQLPVNQVPADELELSHHPVTKTVDVDHISNQIAAEGVNFEIANLLLSSLSSAVKAVCKGQATQYADNGKNLMFNGVNVNACNNAKMTAIHLACQNGHTSIVEILLDSHATMDVTNQAEESPLYLAAKNGQADIADLLIRRGLCDFVLTKDIQTPLQVAIEEGHSEVVEVILKHSARISENLTKNGERLQENNKRVIMPVELLKSDGRRVSAEIVWTERNTPLEIKRNSRGDAPLVLAAFSNDPKMVQLMRGVDLCMYSEADIAKSFRSMIERIGLKYLTQEALSNAIKYRMNLRELAQFLINSSKFNVNHKDWALNTYLHDVMRQRDESSSYGCLTEESNRLNLQIQILNDVIQLLLEKGADFNLKNSFGETILIIASQKGCDQAIQLLFDWEHKSRMKLDIDARDRYGATALIKAAERNHVSVVRLLLNHKASINLYDYYGFTALHAVVYVPNSNWFDLHFFCKWLLQQKFDNVDGSDSNSRNKPTWGKETVDAYAVIGRLQSYLEYNKQATHFKEEVVKLLLDNDEINVNAIDLRGYTPLDLAVKSSKRITSATFEALENRGAIRKLQDPDDEVPIEVARVDERGQNPLHRLILYRNLNYVTKDLTVAVEEKDQKRFDLMVEGILLGPENFRHVVTATDDKGRTPLHYAVMTQSYHRDQDLDLVRVLLDIGSNVNAADIYGKTPLHYAEEYDQYQLLVLHGADENTRDEKGNTPRELEELTRSVFRNNWEAQYLPISKKWLYAPINIAQVLNTHHVTELTKQKLFETIRIYSQSPRPKQSSEKAIWKIWTDNEFTRFNRRLSQLKPLIHQFIERLADGIKEKDWRFECQPTLVGSANEETEAVISADFDFNFKLTKFSQLCDPFPHPLGPKGYFQLRRKPNEDTKGQIDDIFDSFFNLDQCLLTNEVNSRFKIILKEVLSDPAFWQDEHLFEWDLKDKYKSKYENIPGLCVTVGLRMSHPFEGGDGGFPFLDISIDIVACVHVEGWWPEVPLPVGIRPSVKKMGLYWSLIGHVLILPSHMVLTFSFPRHLPEFHLHR